MKNKKILKIEKYKNQLKKLEQDKQKIENAIKSLNEKIEKEETKVFNDFVKNNKMSLNKVIEIVEQYQQQEKIENAERKEEAKSY